MTKETKMWVFAAVAGLNLGVGMGALVLDLVTPISIGSLIAALVCYNELFKLIDARNDD